MFSCGLVYCVYKRDSEANIADEYFVKKIETGQASSVNITDRQKELLTTCSS